MRYRIRASAFIGNVSTGYGLYDAVSVETGVPFPGSEGVSEAMVAWNMRIRHPRAVEGEDAVRRPELPPIHRCPNRATWVITCADDCLLYVCDAHLATAGFSDDKRTDALPETEVHQCGCIAPIVLSAPEGAMRYTVVQGWPEGGGR